MRSFAINILTIIFLTNCASNPSQNTNYSSLKSVQWKEWSKHLFSKAKEEEKLVLLDLGAVWCHWCHVMEETTYQNPKVITLLAQHFIATKVDQDSRPDLANRYKRYGWPATIIFNSQGEELLKRRGYISPEKMTKLLQNILKNPQPEKSSPNPKQYAIKPFLSKEVHDFLRQEYLIKYDQQFGSWGIGRNKFLDWESLEYALREMQAGDLTAKKKVNQSLKAQQNLMDPVWGGVYQYSTGGNWKTPHYEKIMPFQTGNIKAYSLAYLLTNNPSYLQTAQNIHSYLKNFLKSPSGAFYTSQDADLIQGKHSEDYFKQNDTNRRKRGIPKIDTHRYARENGLVISALLNLYFATGEQHYLEEAKKAANWVIKFRSLPNGGFSHGEEPTPTPYLSDSMTMGQAFLHLYMGTTEEKWLYQSEKTAQFIAKNFSSSFGAGFTTTTSTTVFKEPLLEEEENIFCTRYFNQLFHFTGKPQYRKLAEQSMRYLATPEIAKSQRIWVAGFLLANQELTQTPIHITIVGPKSSPKAKALFLAALQAPTDYKRIEWWDPAKGPLPNNDIPYPILEEPAAFVCENQSCSPPITSVKKLLTRLKEIPSS